MISNRLALAFKIFLVRLLWLLPIGVCWGYVYTHLSFWCDSYFGIPEAQHALNLFLAQTKQTPSSAFSLMTSLKEFMTEATLSTKLETLTVVSGIATQLGHLALLLTGCIILWKALKRGITQYQIRQNNFILTQDISQTLLPEIQGLRHEIAHLSTLIQQKGL